MCMGGGGNDTPQQAPPPAPPPPPPRVLDQAAPEQNDSASTSTQLQAKANGMKKYRNDLSISNAINSPINGGNSSSNGLGISM